jgi:methionine-rich copper-binding protein CopC
MRHLIALLLPTVALMCLSAPSFAQMAMKEKVSIAEGAVLKEAPKTVEIVFAHEVVVQDMRLTGPNGKAMSIAYKPDAKRVGALKLPLPALGPGSYRLAWRTAGGDGHVMRGGVNFSLGVASAPATSAKPPADHAGHHGAGRHGEGNGGKSVESSIPDGAVLNAAPGEIVLTFGHPMRLTALRLVTATGERVALSFKPPAAASETITAALPRLDPDQYQLIWTADASDHVMSGQIRFTIR